MDADKTSKDELNEEDGEQEQSPKGKHIVLEVHRPMHAHKAKQLPEED